MEMGLQGSYGLRDNTPNGKEDQVKIEPQATIYSCGKCQEPTSASKSHGRSRRYPYLLQRTFFRGRSEWSLLCGFGKGSRL